LAQILGLRIKDRGRLVGRVVREAMVGGKSPMFGAKVVRSLPAEGGLRTVLNYQVVGTTRYFDAAGFPGRTLGLDERSAGVQAARLIGRPRDIRKLRATSQIAHRPCPDRDWPLLAIAKPAPYIRTRHYINQLSNGPDMRNRQDRSMPLNSSAIPLTAGF